MDIEKLEKEERAHDWQRHRMFCLELSTKLGASSPEQAIEMAEILSIYILIGRSEKKNVGPKQDDTTLEEDNERS
ncbi:MAG TPA: hypothetical protein VNZ45_04335 [Bacteroidia bacterium]|jgi:hypothetical protein|nr:hypothetical protein [Bacteroidia bacterium]